MKTTYIEYDRNGNIKSETITEYSDDAIFPLTHYDCCDECRTYSEKNEKKHERITVSDCAAIAMYNLDLIDDVGDPVVKEFMSEFADLLDENFGDDGQLI